MGLVKNPSSIIHFNRVAAVAFKKLDVRGIGISIFDSHKQAAYANFPVFCRIRSGDLYF